MRSCARLPEPVLIPIVSIQVIIADVRTLIAFILCIFSGLLVAREVAAPGPGDAILYKAQGLVIRATPRTPDQMAAFYEARGFPETMRSLVKEQCFITFRIHNTSRKIVWLDLAHWKFAGPQGEVKRLDRNWWKSRWKEIEAPMPSQSTFRWTLIPEQLDYHFDEAEGGNITLVRTREPFALDAEFPTGADREGRKIRVKIDNLRCADDKK